MLALKPAVPALVNAASLVCHAGADEGSTHFLGWQVVSNLWNCWPCRQPPGSFQAHIETGLELEQAPCPSACNVCSADRTPPLPGTLASSHMLFSTTALTEHAE